MIRIDGPAPLIADEGRRAAAGAEAAAMFGTVELQDCARFAASVHPAALDYIKQAPVLAIGVMAGGGKLNGGAGNRHYTAHKFGQISASGARLRDVMAAYRYPMPMRKIASKALSLDYEDALTAVALLPPSTISQIIPTSVARQRRWLGAIRAWRERLRARGVGLDRYLGWALPQIAKHGVQLAPAEDLADFAAHGDQVINPAWEWPRAVAAAHDWHDRLSAGDARKRFGVMVDQVIDHGKHPDHVVVDGFEFIALRTPIAIHAEGQYMRHCVASYVSLVMTGTANIVSVQRDECHVATLELCNGVVRQVKGRFNARVPMPVERAATAYGKLVRAGI